MKKFLQKSFLILFGIFLGLLSIEVLARLFNDIVPDPIKNSMAMGMLAQSDPEIGITIKPGDITIDGSEFSHTVQTKDLGCPNHAFRDNGKNHNGTTILALGDSFTWGAGVGNDETWPAVLQEKLQLDVINAGYPGIGTQQQMQILKDCGQYLKPDIVIVAFFMNDFIDTLKWKENLGMDNTIYSTVGRPIRVWLAANSYTYQFLKYFILGRFGIGDFQDIYWSGEEVKNRYVFIENDGLNLRLSRDYASFLNPKFHIYQNAIPTVTETLLDMRLESNKLGSKFLVIVLPSKEQVYWQYLEPNLSTDINYDVDFPNNILLDFGSEYQIPLHDLYPIFLSNNHNQLYWRTDGHMNSEGYRLIADSVANYLFDNEWVIK